MVVMKLPNQIQILGEKYKLKLVNGLRFSGHIGLCDFKSKIIQLDAELKGDELQQTLCHELFHAVCYEGSLYQTISPDLEEVVVDLMAKSLIKNFNLRCKP